MKCGDNHLAVRPFLVRALSFLAAAALMAHMASRPAAAADEHPTPSVAADIPVKVRFLAIGVGKSTIIDLPRDVKDVLVADPKIANAVVRSPQRAYIIGIAVGETNVFFFDAAGKQIAGFDIAVQRDLNGLRAAIKQAIPDSDVDAQGIGQGVILT